MDFEIIAGELCLDFVNTLNNRADPEGVKELLCSYEDFMDWATQAGAIEPMVSSALRHEARVHPAQASVALTHALQFREAFFRILEAHLTGQRVEEADRQAVSVAVGQALSQRQLQATRNGFRLGWPSNPINLQAVTWRVADSAARLLTSNDLALVRECGESKCRWMFVDRSKNHSRRWCDMKVCGNRAKVRKFYKRAKER